MDAVKGSFRILTSALQVSRFGRVEPSQRLLRLGCYSGRELFEELSLNAAYHCVMKYSGDRASSGLADRLLALHCSASGDQISVPRWPEASGEQTVLDTLILRDKDLALPGKDLRCNAVVIVHEPGADDASEAFEHISSKVVPELVRRSIPLVLAGALPTAEHGHAARFAAKSTIGRWMDSYRSLAKQHRGHIYTARFFKPQDPFSCFHMLYVTQMAALYPLSRCVSSAGSGGDDGILEPSPELREAVRFIFAECNLEGDGIWRVGDWECFWKVAYGRSPSAAEVEELAKLGLVGVPEERILQWLWSLIEDGGQGDLLWTPLRAFGYDGALNRTGSSEESS